MSSVVVSGLSVSRVPQLLSSLGLVLYTSVVDGPLMTSASGGAETFCCSTGDPDDPVELTISPGGTSLQQNHKILRF